MGAKPGLYLGLMSGTSLDGVDAALVETDGEAHARPGAALTLAYDEGLRASLRALLDRAGTLARDDAALRQAERALTDRHAEAVAALLDAAGVAARDVAALGFHGQTILHRPERRLTWQIGDAARLACATGIPAVHDFRSADVAAGGQGLARPLAVLNLGGVGNVTWIGADGAVLACDTGPGNGPLDDWVAARAGVAFDEGGRIAAAGRVAVAVLARLMAHPFFAAAPPKSLDRLDFAHALAASGLAELPLADGAATLAAFTAASVAAVRAHLPQAPLRWLVTGGGRHNAAIMTALRAALGVRVEPVEAVGWDGDALEAQAFAYLAARSLRGLPLSLPTTTGVPEPMPGGRVARPT